MNTIEVSIPDIDFFTYPSSIETLILSRLKSAGVPVMGTFFFQGVSKGVLSQFRENNNTVYIWSDNETN